MLMMLLLALLAKQLHLSREDTDPALGFDPGGHSKLEVLLQPFQLGIVGKGRGVEGLD